jgi:hypothetical protein
MSKPSVDYVVSQFEQLLLETTSERSFVSAPLADKVSESLRASNCTAIFVDGSTLGSVRVTDDYLACMLESLVGSKITLARRYLRKQRITSGGVKKYLSKYICLGTLKYLDLQGNDLDGRCVPFFGLKEDECPLVSLNISCNPDISITGGLALADDLLQCHRLQHLYVSNCGFDLTSLIGIVSALSENFRMETLEMDRPLLTSKQEEESDHFCRLLLKPSSFITLSLKHSGIRDFGCKLIADSLTRNYSLRRLNLECNRIGVQGAEALASYLIMCPSRGLESLKLAYNEIGNEGCLALAEVSVSVFGGIELPL